MASPEPAFRDGSIHPSSLSNKTSSSKKPSFLGRIGAALGLMQASKFEDADKDEDRLGSASTVKSRKSNLSSSHEDEPPESRKSERPKSSSSSKQSSEKPQSKQSRRSRKSERPSSTHNSAEGEAVPMGAEASERPPSTGAISVKSKTSGKKSRQESRKSSKQSRRSEKAAIASVAVVQATEEERLKNSSRASDRAVTPIMDPKVADENEAARLGAGLMETLDPLEKAPEISP